MDKGRDMKGERK